MQAGHADGVTAEAGVLVKPVSAPSRRLRAALKAARGPRGPRAAPSACSSITCPFPFQTVFCRSCFYLLDSKNSLGTRTATLLSESLFAFHSVCGTLLALGTSRSRSLFSVCSVPHVRSPLLHQYRSLLFPVKGSQENLNELLRPSSGLVFHVSKNLRVFKAIFIPLRLRVPVAGGRH